MGADGVRAQAIRAELSWPSRLKSVRWTDYADGRLELIPAPKFSPILTPSLRDGGLQRPGVGRAGRDWVAPDRRSTAAACDERSRAARSVRKIRRSRDGFVPFFSFQGPDPSRDTASSQPQAPLAGFWHARFRAQRRVTLTCRPAPPGGISRRTVTVTASSTSGERAAHSTRTIASGSSSRPSSSASAASANR